MIVEGSCAACGVHHRSWCFPSLFLLSSFCLFLVNDTCSLLAPPPPGVPGGATLTFVLPLRVVRASSSSSSPSSPSLAGVVPAVFFFFASAVLQAGVRVPADPAVGVPGAAAPPAAANAAGRGLRAPPRRGERVHLVCVCTRVQLVVDLPSLVVRDLRGGYVRTLHG